MHPDWQAFLQQQGAVLDDGLTAHFGKPEAEAALAAEHDILCDLSHYGLISVTGEDAQSFLQNLLSNDIREVGLCRAQLSCLNSAKGRMLAIFLVRHAEGGYLLRLPRTLLEPVRKKLSLYVLRAKVSLADVSDTRALFGLAGPAAPSLVQPLFGDVPTTRFSALRVGDAHLIRLGDNRFQIDAPIAQACTMWTHLAAMARPVGSSRWDWLDIRAGLPIVQPETQEAFVPQMANLEVLGGVNFKKGCYPGQEVVARMQHLGKTKRRMYPAHVVSAVQPRPGDSLHTAQDGESQATVVQAAAAPGGGYDLLAVLPIASRESGEVRLSGEGGAKLTFLPLPYTLP